MAAIQHDVLSASALWPKPRPLPSYDGLRHPTMSDDNVPPEPLPFRPRDVERPMAAADRREPPSWTAVDPDLDPDSPRKSSNLPLVSDDGSPMGSSITNRAYPSGSFTFSHHRPGSAGPLRDSYPADALSESGGTLDDPSSTPAKGYPPRWRAARATHSASPDRPMSRTSRTTDHRRGLSAVGNPDDPGPSQRQTERPPAMIRSSSLAYDDARTTPPPQPSVGTAEGLVPPRRSRQSRENLSYGQESARGLSHEQKAAGGFSAVAGGTAPHGIFLQPETHPITEEQLINEVRGIYAGLVMVEKKCIEIDKQQSESQAPLDNQKWQALIALHRTLLQEHHDFFMASQHPTASPVLRRLAEKYAMPARMWRYGIHSFLELLRHRLPESLDHMLTFIYLAYSMMTLLLETVPAFQETWIECLGDLSRYRMAVEESDLKEREVWASVARYWYNKAADRNPDVGRIQHHLAVLSRPYILQQLFYYTKSLVSVRSFAGTRESILLLFNPILQTPSPSSHPLLITAFVSAHGALFSRNPSDRFIPAVTDFLTPLDKFITRVGPAFRLQGVHIASANFAALLEYGHPDALVPAEFQPRTQPPRSPVDLYQSAAAGWASTQNAEKVVSDFLALGDSSRLAFYGAYLTFDTVSIFLDQVGDQNVFPALHITLVFLWSLSRTPSGMKYAEALMSWPKLVACLNHMVRPWLDIKYIEDADFPNPSSPNWLPEDFYIRGQIWSQSYYPSNFFDGAPSEDNGRNIETPPLTATRMHRCLWLGVRLAQFDRWITYDSDTRTFTATPFALELDRLAAHSRSPFATAEGPGEGPSVQKAADPMQGS